ncbi:1-pyrroline-5-carboxylate dehydrogenase [compost metagenome]
MTGSYFSTDEDRIAEALETVHCGNLYINRKCTGALVGVHPFGGFNMSGTDSKAGGYDYLMLLTQAKMTSRKV